MSDLPDRDDTVAPPACLSEKNACATIAPKLKDAIGHDPQGHRIARRLVTHGIVTPEQAWAMTIPDLFDIRGIGRGALQLLQDRKVMQPDPPTRGTGYSWIASAPTTPQGNS